MTAAPHPWPPLALLTSHPLLHLSLPCPTLLLQERLPLAMTAALRLGCVARLTPTGAAKPLNAEFSLEDFQVGGRAWVNLQTKEYKQFRNRLLPW